MADTKLAVDVTRVDRLPVRVDADAGQILLFVGDRKVASAWGPAVDDPDVWFFWNGRSDPYRVNGGRETALALVEIGRAEWRCWESSLWHPDHGEPDRHGCVKAPEGAMCVGCGRDLGGSTLASLVVFRSDVDVTRHYACVTCEPYLED